MNRILILLILFLLLGIGTFVYFSTKPEDLDEMSVLREERSFAVDTEEVYKIFLADRHGSKTLLERKSDYWEYDGKYRANAAIMRTLLDAIGNIQMKYKPPTAAEKPIIKDIATNGIKVELYDRRNKLLKAYYVGGSTSDERGTHIMMEGAENPLVGHLPGWEGNLRIRFSPTGTDWRDKSIFKENPEDIEFVSVEYPLQKNMSFKLEKSGKNYDISPFYDITPRSTNAYKIGSAEAYLDGFESLIAEAFENGNKRRDSISQTTPFSIITVRDTKGNTKEVRLHPIYNKQSMDLKTGAIFEGEVERYFANCSNGDFMLTQHRVFKKLLWGYEFFFN